ncbi:MAG: hypothetical protein QXW58_02715 [Thermosphaera sp.]
MKLKCPKCGFEGDSKIFLFMYETTLYLLDHETIPEERERPILIICPKCGEGFFVESPYRKAVETLRDTLM